MFYVLSNVCSLEFYFIVRFLYSHWSCNDCIGVAMIVLELPWLYWSCKDRIRVAMVVLELRWSY